MTEYTYTDEQLQAALKYGKDRNECINSMTADVLRLLLKYAEELLKDLFRNATDYEIEMTIADLISELLMDCETLAVDEHKDRKEAILAFILRTENESSLEERVKHRAHTFLDEVATVYLAGKLMRMNYETLLSSIKHNLENPWNNPVLIAARAAKQRGTVAFPDTLDLEPRSYGQGVPVSSLKALTFNTCHAIAEGWNEYQHLNAAADGAVGYFVVRGSGYPCEVCDNAASFFHPIDDLSYLPCLHLHCVCCAVYVYNERYA